MNYRGFNKDGARVSLLGYGAMRFPTDDSGEIDRAQAKKLIDIAYASGVNYYDTAYMYHDGKSELFLADALADYPRDSYFLADKMPMWMADTADDIDRIFDDQLAKCKTDYFDFYLVHAVDEKVISRFDELGAYDKLIARKKAGEIKRLGFSFHDSVEVLESFLDKYEWDFVQLQLNYLDWTYQRAKEQYEAVTSRGIQVIVMEPVRGGSLVNLTQQANELLRAAHPDRTIPAWAMRFAASREGVLCVLSGMSDDAALYDNIASLSDPRLFTAEDEAVAFKAAELLLSAKTVPCTACGYCSACPQNIAIPRLFRMYNDASVSGNAGSFKQSYNSLPTEQQPTNCIDCGLCRDRCPQHIDVPARLRDIDRLAKGDI